ncbi:undecaprenyl-phosphate glucose phosphotransferase [Caballeronia sp.]|uniref:undecaprenyl-phosphate glucose phosphotransferase n=1 Tax=Caballeronia sp. TaxID=1931223 RepID=UPI003C371E18
MPTSKTMRYRLLDVALVVTGAMVASEFCAADLAVAGARLFAASATAFSAALSLAIFPLLGVYLLRSRRVLASLTGRVLFAWFATQAFTLLVTLTIHRANPAPYIWFACWTGVTAGTLLASRVIVHAILSRTRHARSNLRRVAIVGTAEHCEQLVRKIAATPESGFNAVMTLDLNAPPANAASAIPRYNEMFAFAQHVRSENVRELWLALPISEQALISALVDEFRNDLINIRFLPDVRSLALFDGGLVDLIGVPAINLIASPLSPLALARKDIFDRAFATVALVALAPLLLVIALAIKLSSRGPVLFTQQRKGADGQVFRILKFRSMTMHTQHAGVVQQATRNDPRITAVGALLRRTSLDELPQFFNVLRGDMSVVGPRPHAIEHDALYQTIVDDYIHRYRIKPGITGWAQINGFRGETDRIEKMQGRVDHDLFYLRNWSFALDLRIVIATVKRGFKHSNAY